MSRVKKTRKNESRGQKLGLYISIFFSLFLWLWLWRCYITKDDKNYILLPKPTLKDFFTPSRRSCKYQIKVDKCFINFIIEMFPSALGFWKHYCCPFVDYSIIKQYFRAFFLPRRAIVLLVFLRWCVWILKRIENKICRQE